MQNNHLLGEMKMKMKIIKIKMELVIDDLKDYSKESIVDYLNNKLYTDPEFFGDFGQENIESIDDTL